MFASLLVIVLGLSLSSGQNVTIAGTTTTTEEPVCNPPARDVLAFFKDCFNSTFAIGVAKNYSSFPTCARELVDAQQSLDKLSTLLAQLKQGYNQSSDSDFCQLKTQLETKKNVVEKELFQIMRQHALEKELTVEVHNYINNLKQLADNLEDMRSDMRKIAPAHADSCTLTAVKVYTNKQIAEIVENAYSDEDLGKLLKFLQRVPWIRPTLVGYKTLFTVMKLDENLDNPMLLELAYQVEHVINKTSSEKDKNTYRKWFESLKTPVNNSINNFVELINTFNYPTIMRFAKSYNSSFSYYLPQLIQRTYLDQKDNIITINNFLRYLINPCDAYSAYYDLYKRMMNNEHLFEPETIVLASRINKTLESATNCSNTELVKALPAVAKSLDPYVSQILTWWGVAANETLTFFGTFVFYTKHPRTFEHIWPRLAHIMHNGDVKNIKRMVRFAGLLRPSYVFYPSIYQEMKQNNQLVNYEILWLQGNLNTTISDTKDADLKAFLLNILNEIAPYADQVYRECARDVKNGNYSYTGKESSVNMNVHIKAVVSIIPYAYDNDINTIQNIIKFAKTGNTLLYFDPYIAVFHELKTHRNVKGCPILMLSSVIDRDTRDGFEKFQAIQYEAELGEIRGYVNATAESWAESIRNGMYEHVVECYKNPYATSFSKYLVNITKSAYANGSSISEFAEELRPEDKATVLNTLLELC